MSAVFILRYGGNAIQFSDGRAKALGDAQATRFSDEADAWHTAYKHDLNPDLCTVVPPAALETSKTISPDRERFFRIPVKEGYEAFMKANGASRQLD